jgi:hypothetical protein
VKEKCLRERRGTRQGLLEVKRLKLDSDMENIHLGKEEGLIARRKTAGVWR